MSHRLRFPGPAGPLAVVLLALLVVAPSATAQISQTATVQPQPAAPSVPAPEPPSPICQRVVTADVVALDQVYFWNRLGAFQPQGMIYALEQDVIHVNQDPNSCIKKALEPGKVRLRDGKRPRPLVLRANEGDCLVVNFINMLANQPVDEEQPATRDASIHVVGMQYVTGQGDAGMNVGTNANGGVVAPGQTTTYRLYAQERGTYLMYSGGAIIGGQGDGGSISAGLFGAVNVQPRGAEYYRSQVTQADLALTFLPSPDLHPRINYDRRYPSTYRDCWLRNRPVLRMRDPNNGKIVHSDLTAIITGPDRGPFSPDTFTDVGKVLPERQQPFREFTIIFHDEIGAVQAFPQFEDAVLQHTLHGSRDAFAINYGTGGAGAEVLANRFQVGPMWDCDECKYEEFFLTSWAVGDPAMVVDVPANAPCDVCDVRTGTNCTPTPGPKATKVLYPDDPSNVYHSYLNDHVKFRNLHAGSDDHHIFHLHAHQWLHTPDTGLSAYKDSQAIGQGGSFTYETTWGGSGNAPKTPGDSIFHCHFYPHFAQGMWSLWRVHDVLELGTQLDDDGRPVHSINGSGQTVVSTRALPDGEIDTGTPIPALVPIPTKPMAPIPAPVQIVDGNYVPPASPTVNPGFPFWIPGIAGRRPPHPPLDTIDDGGLPRHVIADGASVFPPLNRLDFDKILTLASPVYLPETGTPTEVVAMSFHATAGGFTTPKADGTGSGNFVVNGKPPVAGAPYADPCPTNAPLRLYKAADIQMDLVLNKAGWHYPQQRLITLWEDVAPTLAGKRPPEPFFFRAHDYECIEYQLTNLVPNHYVLDDFQVRTPTDILGQHIHLVKFDVTASDGAANGFNYEDGTLAGEEVRERIDAIRAQNGCTPTDPRNGTGACPEIEDHPFFTPVGIDADCNDHDDWEGAQTTVQRWWADPILGQHPPSGKKRGNTTLRTVFTHDHFGPSTHQQAGLYAGLIIEEAGTVWYENESNTQLSFGRADGGPTSWQARIEYPHAPERSFREFGIEFADFQLAYEPNKFGPPSAGELQLPACPAALGWSDPDGVINPPGRKQVGLPFLFAKPDICPVNACDEDGPFGGGTANPLPPCPESFSSDDPGTFSLNYRNEPVALRVFNPVTGKQTPGPAGDLGFVYESRTDRAVTELNGVTSGYVPYPNLTGGLLPGDPFTPLLRGYEGDKFKFRVLVGAHEEEHNFNVNAMRWLNEPDFPDSGHRNSQMMGISEWFDFEIADQPTLVPNVGDFADFLYRPSASNEGQWNGDWGLMRIYSGELEDLPPLSSNPDAAGLNPEDDRFYYGEPDAAAPESPEAVAVTPLPTAPGVQPGVSPRILCPPNAPRRAYSVVAVAASQALPSGRVVYNSREHVLDGFNADGAGACPDCDPLQPPTPPGSPEAYGPLVDPSGILFVHASDLDANYQLKPGVAVEPLILRARAGECVVVKLTNKLPAGYADLAGFSGVPMIIERFNSNQVQPSLEVGLHPQLVSFDVRQGDGMNVGKNRIQYGYKQTVGPNQAIKYYWYAGELFIDPNTGGIKYQEVELGSTALVSADPIKHTQNGAVGAMIIEPKDSTWTLDAVADQQTGTKVRTRAAATVTLASGKSYREFVVIYQDDLNLHFDRNQRQVHPPVPSLAVNEDPSETGQTAFNYRTEPIWFRANYMPNTVTGVTRTFTFYDQVLLNNFVGAEPQTPIFWGRTGDPARFRFVHPGGDSQNQSFEVQGHLWQELPYIGGSTALGDNAVSNWHGNRTGVGSAGHFDALLAAVGGAFGVPGDYLYRSYVPWATHNGLWGILRVGSLVPDQVPDPDAGNVITPQTAGVASPEATIEGSR